MAAGQKFPGDRVAAGSEVPGGGEMADQRCPEWAGRKVPGVAGRLLAVLPFQGRHYSWYRRKDTGDG